MIEYLLPFVVGAIVAVVVAFLFPIVEPLRKDEKPSAMFARAAAVFFGAFAYTVTKAIQAAAKEGNIEGIYMLSIVFGGIVLVFVFSYLGKVIRERKK